MSALHKWNAYMAFAVLSAAQRGYPLSLDGPPNYTAPSVARERKARAARTIRRGPHQGARECERRRRQMLGCYSPKQYARYLELQP